MTDKKKSGRSYRKSASSGQSKRSGFQKNRDRKNTESVDTRLPGNQRDRHSDKRRPVKQQPKKHPVEPISKDEAIRNLNESFEGTAKHFGNIEWPMRINRYLAHSGYGSRREVESLVTGGSVQVNGSKVEALDTRIKQSDIVTVHGKIARLPQTYTYIAMNKPAGYVVSRKPFPGQPTIYELLPEDKRNLKYAGRLDQNSRGLVILTDDGSFIQQVSHPANRILKRYIIKSEGLPPERSLQQEFYRGIEEGGDLLRAISVRVLDRDNDTLEMVLHEGKNRHIRRMFKALELPVYDLFRLSIGHVSLDRLNIAEGSYQTIEPQDLFQPKIEDEKSILQDFNPWGES